MFSQEDTNIFKPNLGSPLTVDTDFPRKYFYNRGTKISPQEHKTENLMEYFRLDNEKDSTVSHGIDGEWNHFDNSFTFSKGFGLEKRESINKMIGTTPPDSFDSSNYNFHHSQSSTSTGTSRDSTFDSPLVSPFEDGVDGLCSNIVALDLNVDNHISKTTSCPKFDYNLSGMCSMTPNPRSQYKSPRSKYQRNGFCGDYLEKSTLRSKLHFDSMSGPNNLDMPLMPEYERHGQNPYMCKPNKYDNPRFVPQNFSNVQPVQQIILPNGMPAMVVPMYGVDMDHTNKNFKKSDFKSKSFSGRQFDGKHKSKKNNKKISTAIPNESDIRIYAGSYFELSKDQNGCRYLQYKISNEPEALKVVFEEVEPKLQELMVDPFGNYLFQKIIENVSVQHRYSILLKVRPIIIDAAVNLHGTRSVQKFVELCSDSKEQTEILVNSLNGHITKLSKDTNGNHIIQRCLQYFPAKYRMFVFETVLRDMVQITKHRHGCCVFQRCLDASNSKQRRKLIDKVIENTYQLVKDPFGNYVVQYVLDMCDVSDTDMIIHQLLGSLPELSMQKFSSNVIEKCLALGSDKVKAKIVSEITNTSKLKNLLLDQYANYVIQRALSLANDDGALKLVKKVLPHLKDLAHNPTCARRVASKAAKRFPHLYSDPRIATHITAD